MITGGGAVSAVWHPANINAAISGTTSLTIPDLSQPALNKAGFSMRYAMPLDPAGNASLVPSYFAEPGTTIRTDQHNPVLEDIAAMLSAMLVRDGRNGMVGNLNMGSFSIRNLAPGTNPSDAATVSQGVPIASIMDYAGTNAPSGWMLCFGQAISRTTYAALFAAIGTTYGAGDGSTTFNLPDARGRVTAGKDNMGGSAAGRLNSPVAGGTLGSAGGAQTHTLSIGEIPLHDHGGITTAWGAYSQSFVAVLVNGFGNNSFPGGGLAGFTTLTVNVPNHQHGIPAQGGGAAHNNVQPTIILNKIIKVSL